MFRRKKKDEPTEAPPTPEVAPEAASETAAAEPAAAETPVAESVSAKTSAPSADAAGNGAESTAAASGKPAKNARGNRVQKIGTVFSDKMQKTVVVRVDRQVLHPKYRRYVRRTSKFMAHDDLGSTVGDRVRIVETRPLSARKRWRVIEIVQKAAK
ncbi:MAG: 30S ribosomal protein S17 [Acidobacteriota bacterium]